jgi:hypothetical protein
MASRFPRFNPPIPFLLGIYTLISGLLAVYLLFDTWTGAFVVFRRFFDVPIEQERLSLLKTLSYAITGSILGAVIISLRGLHKHAVIGNNFKPSYGGSYLLGPWAAGLLAIAVYGLVRGGLFIFGGSPELKDLNEATAFGYLGLGFFIGFAWDKVLEKLDSMAKEFLQSADSASPSQSSAVSAPVPPIVIGAAVAAVPLPPNQ